MKKRTFLNFIVFAVVLFLTSCSFLDRYDPGFIERTNNKENMKKIKVGMTKQEVLNIMGEPLVDKAYNQPDVWFYYTDWDWADCARTEIESTPIVFKDGIVVGIGRHYYWNTKHKDWVYDIPTETLLNDNPASRR